MAADNRTAIVVATIALTGAIGAAVIANWDKLGRSSVEKPNAAPAPGVGQTITGSNNTQISGSNNVVNPTPTPKPCRDKSHGVERYQRTFPASRDSNWMGGGFNQGAWCNQVIAELSRANPDGAFRIMAQSEDSHTTCAPLNCPQYQYHCTVEVSADPLYAEKLSSACR